MPHDLELIERIKRLEKKLKKTDKQEYTPVGEQAGYSAYYRSGDGGLYVPEHIYSDHLAQATAISTFLSLPGLVGFWPGSAIGSGSGSLSTHISDVGPHGLNLTRNSTVNIGIDGGDIVPYIRFNGGYLNHANATIFDIAGTETAITSSIRGLTLGGWYYFDALGNQEGLISKYDSGGNQRSYNIQKPTNDTVVFQISSNGSTTSAVTSAAISSAGVWKFIVGRFTPSSELKLWVNDVTVTNTTSIPASIFTGSAEFQLGAFNSGSFTLTGRAAHPFLCAASVPTAIIDHIYEQTSSLFT